MRISTREKRLSVATAATVLLFLTYHVLLAPFVSEWQELKTNADGLQDELIRHTIALRQKETIDALYGELQEDIRQRGTDEEEIAELLQGLSGIYRGHGLTDKGTQVLPVEEGRFYRKFRIKMELEGRVIPVADFVGEVTGAGEPFRIEDIRLRAIAGRYEVVRAYVLVSAVYAVPESIPGE